MEKKLEDLQTQVNACGTTISELSRELSEMLNRLSDLEKFVLDMTKKRR